MKGYKIYKYQDARKVHVLNQLVEANVMELKENNYKLSSDKISLQEFVETYEKHFNISKGVGMELFSWLCDFYEICKGEKKQIRDILPF